MPIVCRPCAFLQMVGAHPQGNCPLSNGTDVRNTRIKPNPDTRWPQRMLWTTPYLNISNKSLSSCRCSHVERKQKLTPLRMATVWNAASSSFVIGYSTGSKCRSAHGLRSENPDVSSEKSSFSLGRMVKKSLPPPPPRLPRAWHWRRMVLSPPTRRAMK